MSNVGKPISPLRFPFIFQFDLLFPVAREDFPLVSVRKVIGQSQSGCSFLVKITSAKSWMDVSATGT